LIITIDGPAGAGKSTAARALARCLGFDYLDTGAFYRAATWRAMHLGVELNDPAAIARVAREARIELLQRGGGLRVLCDGCDITAAIRSPEVTASVWRVADQPAARRALIEQQRRFARGRNVVTEGRDQGTEVWPDAAVKFYLDAAPEERVRRRLKDLRALGIDAEPDQVRADLEERDRLDRSRPVGRLRCTEDMAVIDSTHLSPEQVVARMVQEVRRREPDALRGVHSGPGADS